MDAEALRAQLITKFVELTQDRLQAIQLGVLALEKADGAKAAEAVARDLHTLKGEARMLGLQAAGQLAHAMEDVLKAQRDGRAEVRAAIDVLLRACDALGELLEDLPGAEAGTPAAEEAVGRLTQVSGSPPPPLRPSVPSARRSRPAPPQVSAPAAPPPRPSVAPQALELQLGQQDAEPQARERSLRVSVELLDALGLVAGDLLVESARTERRGQAYGVLLQRSLRLAETLHRLAGELALHAAQQGGRGGAAEVEGHLSRLETDLHLLRDDAFKLQRTHADGLTTMHGELLELADGLASARLVPLSSVFEALPRALREMAQAQGKELVVQLDAGDVGVDRTMVADVRDALIHLVRNAVDHGVELPEARQQAGKPRTATVSLTARAEGHRLRVEVADDGRGIDPRAVREAAVRRGVLTAAQAEELSDVQAVQLLFRSGFSTRDEVSELSGRGVGLDVVRERVEGVGGSVGLSSQLGQGTTVRLQLPQSLALVRVLLVRLGEDVYGLPAVDVETVARFDPSQSLDVLGAVTMMHRGAPVPLHALGPLLGLNGGPRLARPLVMVVRHGEERVALAVDGFVGEREVAVKPVGGNLTKGMPFVAGAASLEEGTVALLLHVPDVMGELRAMVKPVQEQREPRRLKVLLVDDSPIARATESALVRALGHEVDEAKDGLEALELLEVGEYQLLLTDVQMPRLDGFDLTRRLKATARFAGLPVVILSSLASPEDKRRGLDAGADAYLVKGELTVDALALTIDRLM